MASTATCTAAPNIARTSSACWRDGPSRLRPPRNRIARFRRNKSLFMTASAPPASVDALLELLTSRGYLAERSLATVTYLSLRMGRPLFLEGEAGVGKTEIAKVLSAALGRKLIRLQCYEGLDVASAVYEWNSAAQMIAIRLAEAAGD